MDIENKKNRINKLMVIGFLIEFIVILIVFTDETFPRELGLILLFFIVIGIIGLIISSISLTKAGPIIVIIGNVLLIPLGIISILGASKELDIIKREKFKSD